MLRSALPFETPLAAASQDEEGASRSTHRADAAFLWCGRHGVILCLALVRLKRAARRPGLSERVATRLYTPEALMPGAAVALDAPQAHRLRHVLRLGAGATVAAFNARDREWPCRLAEQ